MWSGYGKKYEGTFQSMRGTTVTVELHKKSYSGSVININLLEDGVVVNVGSRSNELFHNTIYPSEVIIDIWDTTEDIRNDLLGKDADTFRYIIKDGSHILSCGKIPIIEYTKPLYVADKALRIRGSDGLGDLDNIELGPDAPAVFDSFRTGEVRIDSFKNYIVKYLNLTDLALEVEFVVTWTPQMLDSYTRHIEHIYYNEHNLQNVNVLDILRNFAKEWGARIYQHDGRWRFEQVESQGAISVHRYDDEGNFITTTTPNNITDWDNESDILKYIEQGGNYNEHQASKNVHINWTPQADRWSTGGFLNTEFQHWQSVSNPLYWDTSELSIGVLKSDVDHPDTYPDRVAMLIGDTWNISRYVSQTGSYRYADTHNILEIPMRFQVRTTVFPTLERNWRFTFMIRLGEWYLTKDGPSSSYSWTKTESVVRLQHSDAGAFAWPANLVISHTIRVEGNDEEGNPILPQDEGELELRLYAAEPIGGTEIGSYVGTQWLDIQTRFIGSDVQLLVTATKDNNAREDESVINTAFSDYGALSPSPIGGRTSPLVLKPGTTNPYFIKATSWHRTSMGWYEYTQQDLLAESIIALTGKTRGEYDIQIFSRRDSTRASIAGLFLFFNEVIKINNKLHRPLYISYNLKNGISRLLLAESEFDYSDITLSKSIGRVPDGAGATFRVGGSAGTVVGPVEPSDIIYRSGEFTVTSADTNLTVQFSSPIFTDYTIMGYILKDGDSIGFNIISSDSDGFTINATDTGTLYYQVIEHN